MADSSMTNISAVESYGKNLSNISQQMVQIFTQLKQQTDSVGQYWNDKQYQQFRQDFSTDIMKDVQEISARMNIFCKYIEEMCKIHRMAQNQKYY